MNLLKSRLSADPPMLCLEWRSALFLPQRVQTCISHSTEQTAKLETVGQERCSLSSVMCCTERVTAFLCGVVFITYRIKWMNRVKSVNSEWAIKSSTAVNPTWLKASIFHFYSPFPGYCWFCDFCFVWGFAYLFKKSITGIWTEPLSTPSYPTVISTPCRNMGSNILRQKELAV